MKKVELIFLIPFAAAILAFTSPASAESCASIPGGDFVDRISQIQTNASSVASGQEPGGDEALKAWDEAKMAVEGLCTSCNALQEQYQTRSLEYLTWFREAEVCNGLYYSIGTPGGSSVVEWLACISPVNAGLLAARAAQSAIQVDTRVAPCDANPPTPGGDTIIQAEIYQKTRELVSTIQEARNFPKLVKKLIKRTVKYTTDPKLAGQILSKVLIQKALKSGQVLSADVEILGAKKPAATFVEVAAGTARTLASTPTEVVLTLLPDGKKYLRGPPNQKLRITTTFTPDGGAAISSSRQFRLR